jgi:vanadium-dependent haloperoxidase-like protein
VKHARTRAVAAALAAALAVGIAVLGLGAGTGSALPGDNAVVHWSSVAEQAISAGSRPPASSQVLSGIVHSAMYDAVAATEGGLEPFLVAPQAEAGALPDAAVAKAARDVLVTRIPGQASFVDGAYTAVIDAIPGSQAKADGIAVGAAVASQTLALRAEDHFDDTVAWVQPTPGPGVFEPFAVPPVDLKLTKVVPYTFGSPSDFRPNAPVSLMSGEYASSFAEVKEYGGGAGVPTSRTAEQTDTVTFWLDPTFIQWSRTLRWLATTEQLDLRDSARLFGLVHVAAADTMIACWDAKYHYDFWRPFHAIRRADTDGNHKTQPDTSWTHLAAGNHPEYPSGHACFTGAYAEALQTYFHSDRVRLEIESTRFAVGDPRRTRTYDRLTEVQDDVADARVWGGLHFRSTMEESPKLSDRVVAYVAAHHFRESRGNG